MFEFICGVTIGSIIGIKIYNKYFKNCLGTVETVKKDK